jgi:hypothetical protein
MIRALVLFVACLLMPLTTWAAQPPANYAVPGTLWVTSAGWLDDGRIWFVTDVNDSQGLDYTGPACPPTASCIVWGIIDPAVDAIVSLGAQSGLSARQAERIGDRLFISARTTTGIVPQQPSALPQPLDGVRHLLVVDPAGGVQFGSALPFEFNLSRMFAVGDDVLLAGTAPCPECTAPTYESTRRARLLRLDRELGVLRYDRVMPGRWEATAHVLDDAGRIHFGAFGRDLPTDPQSPLAWRPTTSTLDQEHSGGVVAVEAATGELVHATYLHIGRPTRLAWDPGHDGVWVLAATRDTRFPLSVAAGDSLFCEPGSCVLEGCATLTGMSCRLPQEIALAQLSRDGRTIRHATYIGGPGSDTPHALYIANSGLLTVLGVQERLGSGFSNLEHGPRQLTVLRPETGFHRGPQDDAIASRTLFTVAYASDPRYGDLFARRISSMIPASTGIIHLHPTCATPATVTPPCFQLVWTPHFGGMGPAAEPVPLTRSTIILLALALVLAAAIVVRSRPRSVR